MIRLSVLMNRLLAGAATAATLPVVVAGRAAALRPDPDGDSAVPQPVVNPVHASESSSTLLWIALTVALVALAVSVALTVRARQHPADRRSKAHRPPDRSPSHAGGR